MFYYLHDSKNGFISRHMTDTNAIAAALKVLYIATSKHDCNVYEDENLSIHVRQGDLDLIINTTPPSSRSNEHISLQFRGPEPFDKWYKCPVMLHTAIELPEKFKLQYMHMAFVYLDASAKVLSTQALDIPPNQQGIIEKAKWMYNTSAKVPKGAVAVLLLMGAHSYGEFFTQGKRKI